MDPKNRLNQDEQQVNSNISRARRHPDKLTDAKITLAHGAGGKASAALINRVFYEVFGGEFLAQGGDAAVLPPISGQLAMSTDTYVVTPIEFPGGNIGELAVNGTVNDLAMAGAQPKYLSVGFVLEEGLEITTLRRIVTSMAAAAQKAGVNIVTGDTKVVPKGAADGLYINTAGIGEIPAGRKIGYSEVVTEDRIILSGPIADHGMAVMMARGDLALTADIQSDTQAVNHGVEAIYQASPVHFLRDATRGGLATVLNELAAGSGLGCVLADERIKVNPTTRGACDVLGIDPLYVANEGTFVAVVPQDTAAAAVAALQEAGFPEAAVVGKMVAEPAASVVMVTAYGGTRMVDMLVGDPLPRIC